LKRLKRLMFVAL